MVQFVSLIWEIMPAWPSPRDADPVWHKMVEKDMFGANTPDYTHVEDNDDDHPIGQAKPPR